VCLAFWGAVCAAETSADLVQKTVNRTCTGCHNDRFKSGNLSLSSVKADAVPSDPETWEKVLRKVRSAEMPPANGPKLPLAEAQALVSYVGGELDRAAKLTPRPGRPVVHRLNRAEYSNAIRDLLALDLDHAASLPGDDSGYGFDNIGEVLTVSPLLIEKYMSTARRVARLAVGTVKPSPAIERYTPSRPEARQSLDFLPVATRGGLVVKRYFPLDAEYSLLVRVRGTPDATLPDPKLDLRFDGARVKLFDVDIDPAEEAQHTRNYEIRIPVKAGIHTLGAAFLSDSLRAESGVLRRSFFPTPPSSGASVESITVGGPFDVKGPGDTPSRQRIFSCRPAKGQLETPCARKILTTIARRAYRRPVTPTDIDPLLKLFAAGRKDGGSFDHGIETALRAVLVSPSFLFRVEQAPKAAAPGSVHKVSDLELASRLSFFLWSSLPDDTLLNLAAANKLRPVLNAQIQRMLADPKASALTDNFAGQWLHLRNVSGWNPDPDKYKSFDEPLRAAMQKETELFFETIVREDRSLLEFLDADYTFLNERLAAHYNIKSVKGAHFRRVPVNTAERGGILGQASILLVTSYPTRTSPVLRGKWILENVLGSPPPPPPPDVPDLEDKASTSAKNLRAALEKHRANAACASCHARLDPMGFALENYDAIGKFRAVDDGVKIDASGALPNGTVVDGPAALKKVLLERQEEFLDCLAEKMLTYALGRGLDATDMPAVRQIRRDAEKSGYRFSAFASAIANSIPFQMRRAPQP
jgi:mono/diheme cytochrome c family protein